VPANEYGSISPQDIIRARALFVHKKGKIAKYTASEFSNVIKIPNEFKVASTLLAKINKLDDTNEVKRQTILYFPPKNGQMRVVSTVTEKNMKISKLSELFAQNTGKTDTRFRIMVNVFQSNKPNSWLVVGHNNHKGIYYNIHLFVKDETTKSEDNNIYNIFLATSYNKGREFIKFPPARDKDTINELKYIYKTFMMPWVKLDLIVEKVAISSDGQPIYLIDGTKLNI
jgi:spore germination protein YaaH